MASLPALNNQNPLDLVESTMARSIVFILQHPFYFYHILSLFLTIRHLAISTRHVCSPVLNNNNNNNPLIKTRNDRVKTKQNKQWINNHLVPETCLYRGRKQTKKTLEI